jgi:hypothetical protein
MGVVSRRTAIFGLLLFCSEAVAQPNPVECRIDVVSGVFVPGGYATVAGWVVDHRPGAIQPRVYVTMDRNRYVELERGRPRRDVALHFRREDLLLSMFYGSAPLPRTATSPVKVEVVATATDGRIAGCGDRTIDLRPFESTPPTPLYSGLKVLARAWSTVLLLGVAGVTLLPARSSVLRLLFAPGLGLAILGLASELGRPAHLTPLWSFAIAAVVLLLVSGFRWFRTVPVTSRGLMRFLPAVAFTGLYSVAGAIPMVSHSDGLIMGGIDDAVRECAVADSLVFSAPAEQHEGYGFALPLELRRQGLRPGSSYLLAALSQPSGVRAFIVHSSAMLAAGIIAVLAAAGVALALLPAVPALAITAVLATHSIFLTVLWGQHLGSLLAVPLFLFLCVGLLKAPRGWGLRPVFLGALSFAAAWTFYPEIQLLWIATLAVAFLIMASIRNLRRSISRVTILLLLSVLLNPLGLARAARASVNVARAVLQGGRTEKLFIGDTHYFPPLTVLLGVEPYRLDAAASIQAVRRMVIGGVAVVAVVAAVAGFVAAGRRRRRLVLLLLMPGAAALAINRALGFPYGYSKLLPIVAPLVLIALGVLLTPLVSRPASSWPTVRALPTYAVGVLLLGILTLSIISSRHVVGLQARLFPTFDPAFAELPALQSSLPPTTIVCADAWAGAQLEWIRYLLDRFTVEHPHPGRITDGRPRVILVDRRTVDVPLANALAVSRHFATLPAPR